MVQLLLLYPCGKGGLTGKEISRELIQQSIHVAATEVSLFVSTKVLHVWELPPQLPGHSWLPA